MGGSRRFLARLGAFLRPGKAERELAREVAAHLTLMEDDFRRRGLSDSDARRAALRAYGGVAQAMELHRDARSFVWLEQALQDVRHACRSLRKSPGFVALALVSLAFGIGVNTAIFTLVNGILLKRLPVADPDRIVQLRAHIDKFDGSGFAYPVFRQLRRQNAVFADVIAFHVQPATLDDGEARQPIDIELVSGSYFAFFGARPVLGRLLEEADDDVESARPVCVISYQAWRSRFAADPQIVGRTVHISGAPLQIVGVAPPDFTGANLQRRNDLWAPTAVTADVLGFSRNDPTRVWLGLLGRLKPGIARAEAEARLEGASAGIEALLPRNRANRGAVYGMVSASKGYDSWRTSLRDPLLVLMSSVTLVLLVACANLANLLLARAGERQQEFAVKLSLGISRPRLLRQLLIETFAITFTGGALGLVLAEALTGYLLALFNSGSRFLTLRVAPDRGVLLYTLGGCVVTALVAGLYPAWQASRTEVSRRLGAGASTRRGVVLRRSLIVAQVTLAVVLLFGASLFTHSLRNLKTVPLGIEIDRVLAIDLADSRPGARAPSPSASLNLVDLLARIRQLPAVEAAALSQPSVLSGSMMSRDLDLTVPGHGKRHLDDVYYMLASPGFLATLHLPLERGRDFTAADRPGAPVALVNERMAALAWPGEDPVGKRIDGWGVHNAEVIGVIGNSHYVGVREESKPIVYEPFAQEPIEAPTLEIRCRGPFAAVERDVRRLVRSGAPGFAVRNASAMTLMRDNIIAQDRLLAFLSAIFGALGTGLALVGIYGLISYSVARRTREVGIRMSVGAREGDVLWLFLRESVVLVAAGIVLGLPLGIALARFIRAMLYQVSATEPLDIAITIACLAAGGVVASWLPGRRATRIDPVRALRCD
jgi:predicted permease